MRCPFNYNFYGYGQADQKKLYYDSLPTLITHYNTHIQTTDTWHLMITINLSVVVIKKQCKYSIENKLMHRQGFKLATTEVQAEEANHYTKMPS